MSEGDARSYVREAAEAGDSVLSDDPVGHIEEKIRRATIVLRAMGIEAPAPRPLWKSQAWPSVMPPSLGAELLVNAGTCTVTLTTRDLESPESFVAAFAERCGINVHVDGLAGDEPAPEAWPRVVMALRWLAIEGRDARLLSRSAEGSQAPSSR